MAALSFTPTASIGAPRALAPRVRPSVTTIQHASSRSVPSLVRVRAPTVAAERRGTVVVHAAAAAGAPAEESSGGGLGATLLLGALFAGWYGFNIYFNICNKQVLKAFAFPVTCTWIQLAVGAVIASSLWLTGAKKLPDMDKSLALKILPLACVHTLGNLLTNVSLGAVAVSFTHTIKAMEPFFSVLLSWLFLGDAPTTGIVLSLFPIVGGVAAASMAEASFNWTGFLAAMGSNITFQSRNVLSKKVMGGAKVMDNINLFGVITCMSAVICAPVMLLAEGFHFTPSAMQALGVINYQEIMKKALIAGVMFHSYQQVSYMILERVTPVTHSIGNCVKRIIVIVASVVVFNNPMSRQNAIGTAVALAGVFAYSQVKRLGKAKPKAA